MTHQNEEESDGGLKANIVDVRQIEDNGGKACLVDSTVEILRIEGVAEEPEVAVVNSETEGRIEANSEGGELYEDVLDEQNDVVMEESGKKEEKLMGISSGQRKVKLCRTSNTMKKECLDVKGNAYKTLWESQTDACGNIIALEKMLKQCRKKDQQNKAVSGIDDVTRLPLSMESCKELRRLAHKIESQLSEIIDSIDGAVVPYNESRGCEIEDISKGFVHEGTRKRKTRSGSCGSEEKPQAKKTRMRRLKRHRNNSNSVRKSPRWHKPT